jgi:hypothetical protein
MSIPRLNTPPLLLALLLLGWVMAPGLAESIELGTLAQYSEVIVFGRVESRQSQWEASSPNIITHTRFRVEDCIKGGLRTGETVTIETSGGEINGMIQQVPHAARFNGGQYALVFLTLGKQKRFRVFQGESGVISLFRSGKNLRTGKGEDLFQLIREIKPYIGDE